MNYFDLIHKIKKTKIISDSDLVKPIEIIISAGIMIALIFFLFSGKLDLSEMMCGLLVFLFCFCGFAYICEYLCTKRAIKKFGENFSSFIKEQKIKGVIFLIIFHNVSLSDEEIDSFIALYMEEDRLKNTLHPLFKNIFFSTLVTSIAEMVAHANFDKPFTQYWFTSIPIFLLLFSLCSLLQIRQEKKNDFPLMLNWYKMLRDDLKK